jgi:predicted DsbA family dithiol-disulfide isomerase
VVTALRKGADLDVRFLAFSLDEAHAEEGQLPVWERAPGEWGTGVLALLYGIAARDQFAEQFFDAHLELFAARFDRGQKLGHEEVLREAVGNAGLDPDTVAEEVWSGRPLKTLASEHTDSVDRWGVFGVPTFIEGDEAVFVRLMERNRTDDLDRMLELLAWSRLNEFKRTRIPR